MLSILEEIPKEILNQEFSYEEFASGGTYGEEFAVARVIKECYIEIELKILRGKDGDSSTVNGIIFFNGSQGIIKNSKATVYGKTYTVFDVFEPRDPFSGIIHHTEVILQEIR